MPIKLYKMDLSPPARAAMMACDLLGVPAELVDVNLFEAEHLKPNYLKINPLHTVPVLVDGDFTLHDSHAIMMYLVDTYGKDDSFYPKNITQRALVNQKLFFESAILFPRLRNITYHALLEGQRKVSEKQLNDIDEAFGFLEEFLSRSKYLANEQNITIADIAAYATVSSLTDILPIDSKKYPKTQTWVMELEQQPFCKKFNEPGAATLKELLRKAIDF